MSVRAIAWVLHDSPATGNDRLVLIAIADEADDEGRNAYPSQPLIAHKARVGRRTVQRALVRLEAGGQLLVRRPDRAGRGHHNRYVVTMGRDPVALAAAVGWPAPALDVAIAEEWRQCDAVSDGPHDGDIVGDNSPPVAVKGAERRHGEREKAPLGGARPVNPMTQGSAPLGDGDNPRRRRGLDPSTATMNADAIVRAQRELAAANDARLEQQRNTPRARLAPDDFAAARATIRRRPRTA